MTFHNPTTGRFLAYDDGAAFHLVELPAGTSVLGRSQISILPLDGERVWRRRLRSGDTIRLGNAALGYVERPGGLALAA